MKIKIGNVPIYYEVRGEGRPILFLHGNPNDHVNMLKSYEPIFENIQGWKRYYVDLPGMGKTPGSDTILSNDDIVDLLSGFLGSVANNREFALVGFSYGGYLARALAYKHANQCIGLMLMAPTIAPQDERNLPEQNVIVKNSQLFTEFPEQVRPVFEAATAVQTQYIVERTKAEILPALLIADHDFLAKVRNNFRLSYHDDMNEHGFDKPSLFLMGRQDIITGYADALSLHEQYPRTTLVVLDRCGHGPQFDQQSLFETLTQEWLFRVEESLH